MKLITIAPIIVASAILALSVVITKSRNNQTIITCSPCSPRLGDSFVLHFSIPHGKDLAVVDPDGVFHWLVSFKPDQTMTSLVDWQVFASMPELRIDTLGAYEHRKDGHYHIFAKPGIYQFLLSENIEMCDADIIRYGVAFR